MIVFLKFLLFIKIKYLYIEDPASHSFVAVINDFTKRRNATSAEVNEHYRKRN